MKRWLIILVPVLIAAATIAWVAVSAPWSPAVPAPFIASEDNREPIPENAGIEVRYIANEGVLISSRDKRVLIDGLHRRYGDEYAFLPDAEREEIETAKPPFDGIDLVLVSHMHGDHFHPESVGRYLKNNPKAVLATSQQVVDEAAGKFADYAAIKDRVTPVVFTLKQRNTMKLAGIDIEFLGVGHGAGRHGSIQNLGHVFTLGGKKFLHIGDAPTSPDIFEHFNLDEQAIDIAFMPAWFLTSTEGRAIVREHIKPKHIIAVHVGPGEGDALKKRISSEFPAADVFATMLEKRFF